MNLESNVEFPPLGAILTSPDCTVKKNAATPLASLNSTLNPQAEVFTPRPAIDFSGCFVFGTPEQVLQVSKEKSKSDRITRSKASRKFASETRSRFFEWQECGRVAGKRRYSMMSSANTTISSIDTHTSEGMENENDPDVLKRREKNISYGKNTDTYQRYIKLVPKDQRIRNSPRTPSKDQVYSRRQWDGLIKHWKINLHNWEREVNGETKQPIVSTPKRAKTKCDRRSFGTNITNGYSPVRNRGDMLAPQCNVLTPVDSMKENAQVAGLMLPPPSKTKSTANHSMKQDVVQDEDMSNIEPIDWSLPSTSIRIDWSKECCLSDEESQDEKKEIKVEEKQAKLPEDEVSMDKVYKCGSLVEAIAVFDENTYNEDEDEDYLPPGVMPKREELRFEPAIKDEDSQSIDQHNIFNRITRSKYPYKPQ